MLALYVQTKRQDPIVRMLEVPERLLKPAKLFIGPQISQKFVDRDPDSPATRRLGSVRYKFAILIKTARQKPVDRACVCSPLGLFVLELVGLTEHVDRDPNVIIGKSIDGMGIMQQNIGIKNIVLDLAGMTVPRTGLYNGWPGRFLKEPRLGICSH